MGMEGIEPGDPALHGQPEAERIEQLEPGERADSVLDGVRRSDAGYRDQPLREFRAEHEGEFLEPMARTYPVERFGDPDEVVRRINPDYGDASGYYDINCADCARSVERTWRGDHEEAAGRLVQVDADGNRYEGEFPAETEEWAGERFTETPQTDALRERLEAGGHGSSAIVQTSFDFDGDRLGHAYNVVNHHGELRVCDGQTGETFPWAPGSIYELGENQTHLAMAWNGRGERIW